MDPSLAGIHGFYNVSQQRVLPHSNQFKAVREDVYEFRKSLSDGLSTTIAVPNHDPDLGHILPHHADLVRFATQPQVRVGPGKESFWPSGNADTDDPSFYFPPAMMGFVTDSSFEDNDFSETCKHITQILMEENMEQRPSMFYDPLSLQVTEKSFYDALGGSYPLSPDQQSLVCFDDKVESPDGNLAGTITDSSNRNSEETGNSSTSSSSNPPLLSNAFDYKTFIRDTPLLGDSNFQSNSQLNSQKKSVLHFKRGLEEASKFLPKNAQLSTVLESSVLGPALTGEPKVGKKGVTVSLPTGLKGVKEPVLEDSDFEDGRRRKQSAIYLEEAELSELFDKVLLDTGPPVCAVNRDAQDRSCKGLLPIKKLNASDGGKIHPKKQGREKETVDLRNLLLLCAQAVSGNDSRTASELIKQIRQHASPLGDGSQRLAHFFANGLEARCAGSGNGVEIYYNSVASSRISAIDILKAYKVHVSSCPFKKFALFFANRMITKAVEHSDSLHIIDFGIVYGFQWPTLIKALSTRPGGPPKLRITGIELPQTGFRPKKRIEETGCRLATYCKRFNVPFEFNAIASQRWETIQIEELKIDSREVLAVNCMFRLQNLLDETVEVNCPRNAVLSLIRKMNPDIFVQNILNGAYDAPFFFSRFKEALFHFSALFDMFDTVLPRESEYRLMFEREFYGRESMNVIACEGLQRVERPETYKQWQVRLRRCGFRQLPLDQELIGKFRDRFNEWYHRDFAIDEDCDWMLQGWKGRVLYASSCWVPA